MDCKLQQRTPLFSAVQKYSIDQTVPFHVPGHKQGRGCTEFMDFAGSNILSIDLTCLPDTDNLLNPKGVIDEAQMLAADLYGADQAFFLVNGTTSGIQAMLAAVLNPGDKVIIPRNAHKSAVGGLIISGACPVYVEPEIDWEFGISMGITEETLAVALERHPDVKAVFLINPNYYGTASNLAVLVELAHSYGIPVIVDEAHGAHLPFDERLPISAMAAGADLAASSTHKLGGSLTQSSILLLKAGLVSPRRVRSVLNLTQTTSPSYILLASLDAARKQLALHGEEIIGRTVDLALKARKEIKEIPGLKLLEIKDIPGCFALDPTKVTVNVQDLGLSGYEMEKILREHFGIQVELSDLYNVLFLFSLGDDQKTVAHLLSSLKAIAYSRTSSNMVRCLPPPPGIPHPVVLPRDAFYSNTLAVPLDKAEGAISAEAVMAYPPGIPLVCPGERITREVIDYIRVLKQEKAELEGTEDPQVDFIKVLKDAEGIIPLEVVPVQAEDVG